MFTVSALPPNVPFILVLRQLLTTRLITAISAAKKNSPIYITWNNSPISKVPSCDYRDIWQVWMPFHQWRWCIWWYRKYSSNVSIVSFELPNCANMIFVVFIDALWRISLSPNISSLIFHLSNCMHSLFYDERNNITTRTIVDCQL